MQAYENEPPFVRALAGALASMSGEAVTLPIDTIKIRLQLAGEGGAAGGPRLGMVGTGRAIVAAEGVRGLFKGLAPGLLRQASYQSIKMGLYEPLRDALQSLSILDSPADGAAADGAAAAGLFDRIVAGGLAGSIGAGIANPTDLIKVRLQADASGTRYKGMIDAAAQIIRSEGVLAFWKGVTPNMYRAFIVNAAELATYDTVKIFLLERELIGDNIGNHFVSSFTAGFVAAVTSTPVDITKTRLMNQPTDPATGKGLRYSGMADCFVKTARAEGFLGLYKGFFATWLRIGPWAVVMFTSFELYRSILNSMFNSSVVNAAAEAAADDAGLAPTSSLRASPLTIFSGTIAASLSRSL
ncbi:uncharacterized protein AMSG_11970 [Thecamonas trahens ATCC 50062]|uniref:Uncharacterized protein n=1 Tax=Thecamonas trahens ATCC 50062 TaxID=461836 RepID=A0A0L0DDL1_THETB|nr:hypothetical protein AMSG_11970 [Thecamonas trahens ATCC 50062]KNC50201.1 hypothetical protein AMSG_11970 [Thecamonas trahens ATCC 50062]|eukprot:XP_013757127.1 hypothetical protein AMSG_11970 [Thecamonas trahens ATCC 50062]